MLSKFNPVGLMIYNSVRFMDIPFETLIALYGDNLNNESFDSLEEYAQHFLEFIRNVEYPYEIIGFVDSLWINIWQLALIVLITLILMTIKRKNTQYRSKK